MGKFRIFHSLPLIFQIYQLVDFLRGRSLTADLHQHIVAVKNGNPSAPDTRISLLLHLMGPGSLSGVGLMGVIGATRKRKEDEEA